jgi:CRP-like cAMP-binding protein
MADYAAELARLPILEGITGQDFELIASRFRLETYPAGVKILEQGFGGLKLFVVLEGKIRVFRTMNGSKIVLTTLEAPETFGELSIIDGDPASASVEAETDVKVLTLQRDDFYEALDGAWELQARVWNNLLKTLCRRLRNTTNQVQDYFAINKALCENESFRSFYKLFYS